MRVATLSEELLFTTVKINVTRPNGNFSGTGFIFNYTDNGKTDLFLVTNKHVIKDALTGKFFFTKKSNDLPELGNKYDLELQNFGAFWFGHPDAAIDIAVMSFSNLIHIMGQDAETIFFKAIPNQFIPSKDETDNLDAIEEVIFVGYPSGIFDSTNLIPIVRRGITATPPYLSYEGKPTFLIDAFVFPGSSGSPVLIWNMGSYGTRSGLVLGDRVHLLGVVASVLELKQFKELRLIPGLTSHKPVVPINQLLNLGIVFKSSTIVETIEHFLKNPILFGKAPQVQPRLSEHPEPIESEDL